MRDHLLGLCNLICQDDLDSAALRAAELCLHVSEASHAVLLLLDATATSLIVTGGAANGDANWAPAPGIYNAPDQHASEAEHCPLFHTLMTGRELRLDNAGNGFDLSRVQQIIPRGAHGMMYRVVPLTRRDGTMLGVMLLAGVDMDIPFSADAVGKLLTRGISAHLELLAGLRRQKEHRTALERSLKRAEEERKQLRKARQGLLAEEIPGQSEATISYRNRILACATKPVDCLISGPPGAEFEQTGRVLHEYSSARGEPFCYVSGALLTEEVFAPELFGHKRGAVTGVAAARRGLLSFVGKGTLFIDDIDRVSGAAQIALLRVMEQRSYKTIGSSKDTPFEGRILGASSVSLAELAAQGGFEPSLYFRLRVHSVTVPTLEQCRQDLSAISASMLRRLKQKGYPSLSISDDARQWLSEQSFPGDRAELFHLLTSVADQTSTAEITRSGLEAVRRLAQVSGGNATSLPEAVRRFESEKIRTALAAVSQNRAEAAKLLGIPKRTLAEKCKRLKI